MRKSDITKERKMIFDLKNDPVVISWAQGQVGFIALKELSRNPDREKLTEERALSVPKELLLKPNTNKGIWQLEEGVHIRYVYLEKYSSNESVFNFYEGDLLHVSLRKIHLLQSYDIVLTRI